MLAEAPRHDSRRIIALTAVAGVALALAAGIYLTAGDRGNSAADAACAAAPAIAAGLDPLLHGEIAAFQLAREPRSHADLAFVDDHGEPATLAAFAGKVALVNLWATWCAPCRAEMPALDRLQAALGGDGFTVVPVSVDTADADRPRDFLESIGIKNLPLYTDRSTAIFLSLKERGLALGLPVTLLLDRNGCGLGHINGPAEWDSPEGKALIEAAVAAGMRPEGG